MYYGKSKRQIAYVDEPTTGCKQVGVADIKGYDIIRRVYSRYGKAPSLTTMQGGHREPKVECRNWENVNPEQLYWRALTPLECERLQTVPDLYTQYGEFDHKHGYLGEVKPISNSQRYKMLGNGFTVDVIAHILKGVDA